MVQKIAFMTSVWGVLLSVAFNFIEKILEQIIRKKLSLCKTVLTGCSLD